MRLVISKSSQAISKEVKLHGPTLLNCLAFSLLEKLEELLFQCDGSEINKCPLVALRVVAQAKLDLKVRESKAQLSTHTPSLSFQFQKTNTQGTDFQYPFQRT